MGEKWIKFIHDKTGKELLKISEEGTFEGEIENTKSLLAYEQGLDVKDIKTVIE